MWPQCCAPGEVLYLPSLPSRPACEPLQGAGVGRPEGLAGLGLAWGGGELEGGLHPRCKEGEQVHTLSPGEFTLVTGEGGPRMGVANTSLALSSYCLELGVEDGMPLQLFGQACLPALPCPHPPCLSICSRSPVLHKYPKTCKT